MSGKTFRTILCGIVLFASVSCAIFNSSSAVPQLPNYGVFLIDRDSFTEIKQYKGKPSESSIQSEAIKVSSDPVFLVWYPEINQQYFLLVNMDRPGTGISYRITPRDDKGQILEIKPESSLQDGFYCFIQGDPLGSPFSLPYWCFRVGDTLVNNSGPTDPAPQQDPSSSNPSDAQEIRQEWTIKTGDIQYIGVASDGTIYGVGPGLYAVISKDGSVLHTNQVDLKDCLRDNFSGGSGDMKIDRWFVAKPDGTLITTAFTLCIVSPGDPPAIEIDQEGDHFPYSDDNSLPTTPKTPEGFANNFAEPYRFYSRLDGFNFFFNEEQRTAGFIDHNGEIRYFKLSDEVNMEKYRGGGIEIVITPWDDVYYSFPMYDQLGNELGRKTIKIKADGTTSTVNGFPSIGSSSIATDLGRLNPMYLPEREELYFNERNLLTVYDLDFNYLRGYTLPASPEFPKPDNTNKMFMGHDGALYTFNIGTDTLTKYSLPSNETISVPTPMPASNLDPEAILFRDKALTAMHDLTSMEFTGIDLSTTKTPGLLSINIRSLQNAFHEIVYFEDGHMDEGIYVDNNFCYINRSDSSGWQCQQRFNNETWTPISLVIDVLNGYTSDPAYKPIRQESTPDTNQGIPCRSFLLELEYKTNDTVRTYRDRVCFDMSNYLPVYWYGEVLFNDGNALITERSDFKFNDPIEITLPTP